MATWTCKRLQVQVSIPDLRQRIANGLDGARHFSELFEFSTFKLGQGLTYQRMACVPGCCLQKTAGKSTCQLRRCEDLQPQRALLGGLKTLFVPSETARDNNGSTGH